MELFLTIVIWFGAIVAGIIALPFVAILAIMICALSLTLVVSVAAIIIMGLINLGDWFYRTSGCK